MGTINTKSLHVNTAKEFIDSISQSVMNVSLYVAASHAEPWTSDPTPDVTPENTQNLIKFWRSMMGGKKVTGNDVCPVVPRINWTTGTVYTPYTDNNASSLYSNNFYVMTDTYNVYKCIENANNAQSTVKPTYTSTNTTNKESDGYIWKYMYTPSVADRNKFLTTSWMPCRTLLLDDGSSQWQVQQGAIDGSIQSIVVTSAGTGYTNTSNVTIAITGDGSSAAATANLNVASQTVSSITMTIPGSGYHFANATISGGGGSGAIITPIISPIGGHGSDAMEELGASNVMINIQLINTESGKLSIQNDYRQIGLIKNPLTYGTSNVLSNSVFSQTFNITLSSGVGDYVSDEYVYQGAALATATFSGRVLDWDTGNNAIKLVQVQGTPATSALNGLTSGTSRFVISTTYYDAIPYSGRLLYIDNIAPVQRAINQTETITFVLSF